MISMEKIVRIWILGLYLKFFHHLPPKFCIILFFINASKLKKTCCAGCVQILFLFRIMCGMDRMVTSAQVFKLDFSSWRYVDFFKKCSKILPHKVGGSEGFEIDQICGFCLRTKRQVNNFSIIDNVLNEKSSTPKLCNYYHKTRQHFQVISYRNPATFIS